VELPDAAPKIRGIGHGVEARRRPQRIRGVEGQSGGELDGLAQQRLRIRSEKAGSPCAVAAFDLRDAVGQGLVEEIIQRKGDRNRPIIAAASRNIMRWLP